jgi:transcription elongation factor Elf1
MPRDDPGYVAEDQEEEDRKTGASLGSKRRFDEFDCPACSANNPMGDGFGNSDELICNYCGLEFKAEVDDEGHLKLKET